MFCVIIISLLLFSYTTVLRNVILQSLNLKYSREALFSNHNQVSKAEKQLFQADPFPPSLSYISLRLSLDGGIQHHKQATLAGKWRQKPSFTDQEKQETWQHLPREMKWKQSLGRAKNYAASHPAPVTAWQQQRSWCWMQESTQYDSMNGSIQRCKSNNH